MKIFYIAVISILLSVAAQFSFKAGMSSGNIKVLLAQPFSLRTLSILLDKYVFTGFLLYGAGAIIWLNVLSKWDVSKAYPLVGLGFALTVFVGFFAGEQVTISRLVGIILICVGVFLVGKS